jgi:ABC-type branched-subunit amino acid transport system substrate-binding protein
MPHRSARLIVGLLAGAVLTACSSAPLPTALEQPPGGPAGSVPAGTTGTTVTPATTGVTGTTTGPGTTGGGAVGGTTGQGGPIGSTGRSTGAGGSTTGPSAVPPLFTPAEDRTGITKDVLRLCAHSALTYGAAFQTGAEDFNVFWTELNQNGGLYGRRVEMSYENDDYKPDTAVVAAKTCEAKKIFMLIGGIGFDQIPAVRNYVETRHLLYLHSTATVNGSQGKRYSFSLLPTVERVGEGFAQLAVQRYAGKKIGILKRDSVNWEPGVAAFKRLGRQYGIRVVDEEKAANNAGNYSSQIQNLKNAGAEVVFVWLNALETVQVVRQMRGLAYTPDLMVFPFNLTTQTLMNDALSPVLTGVAFYPAYSYRDYTGPFAAYADDMKEFEAQYAEHRPNVDLSGVSGDLLFLNWTGQKALYKLLLRCGKDCTRTRFVDILKTYRGRPISSACPLGRSDGLNGSEYVTFMEAYSAPNGTPSNVKLRETQDCVRRS